MTEQGDEVNNDSTIPSNVLPLKDKKRTRDKKNENAEENTPPDKPKKLKPATIELGLCLILDGSRPPLLANMPAFDHCFEKVRFKPTDQTILIEINKNTATIVDTDYVGSKLRDYVKHLTDKQADYAVEFSVCAKIASAWSKGYIHRKILPKSVGFLSDPELCLNRLEYDPINIDFEGLKLKAPIFYDYLTRMTNADAFCARVGSIFDFRAHRKQAIWIQGVRNAGKSPLMTIISKLVGDSYAVMSEKLLREKFWKEGLVGKRVMLTSELKPGFLLTEDFKGITGDSMHKVRPFGAKAFDTILEPILFFFSNHAPEVPNDDPITDRIIACKLGVVPLEKRIATLDLMDAVEAELPYIAGYCLAKWALVPKGHDIPIKDNAILNAAVESYEAEYLDFVENYLERGSSHYRAELVKVALLMRHVGIRSSSSQSACKRVLLSQAGVTESRITFEDGKRRQCYSGLRIQSQHERLIRSLEVKGLAWVDP